MIIAILDSGYSGQHIERIVGGISIVELNGKIVVSDNYSDEYGHGTAVTDLLINQCDEEIEFYIVKILDSFGGCDSRTLQVALTHLLENGGCDVLHISAGVERLNNSTELYNIIEKLKMKKIYTVAAFANGGAVSYPAAFDNVIGVDISANSIKKNQYESVEGSIVNYRTSGGFYRVNWMSTPMIISGSSFSSTTITAQVAKAILDGHCDALDDVIDYVNTTAVYTYEKIDYPLLVSAKTIAKKIQKAIVFPFNKEVFQIAGNENLCDFEVSGYYTTRFDINLNKSVSDVLKYSENKKQIKDIESVNWEDDFDTIILGHYSDMLRVLKRDIVSEIFEQAEKYNKRIYSFSNIGDYIKSHPKMRDNVSFPYIDIAHVPQNRFGKLRKTGKPVVAVYGTSSKQGKFHVQLALRKQFVKDGYKPYQISTEPTGYLFGMECVLPIGFETTFYLTGGDSVLAMNEVLYGADTEESTLIIVGGQSGTVPHRYDNIALLTIQQLELIMAINPDAVVLCINYDDSINYIQCTKNYIESITPCSVIAMCMLPVRYERKINTINAIALDKELILKRKLEIYEKFNVNLFEIGNESEMKELYRKVIEFF